MIPPSEFEILFLISVPDPSYDHRRTVKYRRMMHVIENALSSRIMKVISSYKNWEYPGVSALRSARFFQKFEVLGSQYSNKNNYSNSEY